MKRKTVVALLATMALTAGSVGTVFAMSTEQFSDVKAGASYYSYIETLVDAGIMKAGSETEFGVAETETRGDFIQELHALAKNPLTLDDVSFEDVKGTDNELAVRWAEVKNLFEGLNPDFFVDGKFEPDKELTREEMAVILYNYGKYVDGLDMSRGLGSYDSFADSEKNKVSDTYAEQVKWAVGNKLLVGDDKLTDEVENNLRPTESVNRVEVAEALYQYISLRDMLNAEKKVTPNETDNNRNGTNEQSNSVNTTTPIEQNAGNSENEIKPENKPVMPEKPVEPEKPDNKPVEPETPVAPEKPEAPHEHEWVDNMVEVKHPEEGHWEEVEVKPAWVETIEHEAEYEDKWVVDVEAQYETVHHDAEYEKQWVVDVPAQYDTIEHEAEYEDQYVVDVPAQYETVNHPAQYEDRWVVDKAAWDEDIYEDQIRNICNVCGEDITGNEDAHGEDHWVNEGKTSGYYNAVIPVKVNTIHHDEVGHTEQVLIKDAWDEQVKIADEIGHTEKVLVKDAWTEEVKIADEQGHYEDKLVKDEWDEQVKIADEIGHTEKVLVKDAWTEEVSHEAEYEKTWVVDQEEYTEMVAQGEICNGCGETR